MATIMSWGNGHGTFGRCDQKCHGAQHDKCTCMCGGKFHGSANQPGGVAQALDDNWGEVVEQASARLAAKGMQLVTERWGKNRQPKLL